MDNRSRFIKWFSKHPRFYSNVYTIAGLAAVYTLFYDVLHGNFLKQLLLLAWYFFFGTLGQACMESCLCFAAARLEAENK